MSRASVDQVKSISIVVDLYKKTINKNKVISERQIEDIKNFLLLIIS